MSKPNFFLQIYLQCFKNFIITEFCLQRSKDYKFLFEKAFDCQPVNETYPLRVSDMKGFPGIQSFYINGKIEVLSKMPRNIELELGLTRCNIDKTGCHTFEKMAFPRICEKLTTKTSIAYRIRQAIVPNPNCPFDLGTYYFTNSSSFSLNTFRMIPLDGYFWKLQCKFHEKNGFKRIKTIACLEIDVSFPTKFTREPKTQ